MLHKSFIETYFTKNPLWYIYAVITLLAVGGALFGVIYIIKNQESIHYSYQEESATEFHANTQDTILDNSAENISAAPYQPQPIPMQIDEPYLHTHEQPIQGSSHRAEYGFTTNYSDPNDQIIINDPLPEMEGYQPLYRDMPESSADNDNIDTDRDDYLPDDSSASLRESTPEP